MRIYCYSSQISRTGLADFQGANRPTDNGGDINGMKLFGDGRTAQIQRARDWRNYVKDACGANHSSEWIV